MTTTMYMCMHMYADRATIKAPGMFSKYGHYITSHYTVDPQIYKDPTPKHRCILYLVRTHHAVAIRV